MLYQQKMLLHLLKLFNGERSIYGIYHLLKGKKSAQTLQDATIFNLQSYFGTGSDLQKHELEQMVGDLQQKGWIHSVADDGCYIVTDNGLSQLAAAPFQFPPHINGWRYREQARLFWQRLRLTVQTLSHLINHHSGFSPVITDYDVLQSVREYLLHMRAERWEVARSLYHELEQLLRSAPEVEAELIVRQLSGKGVSGLTLYQVAQRLKLEPLQAEHLLMNRLHYILQTISVDDYPHLYQLAGHETGALTYTALKTERMLEQGYMLNQIAELRKLKRNTIEDHIVEIAMNRPSFDISVYVDLNKQQYILKTVQMTHSKRLRDIKEKLPDDYRYFDIRLVLAKGRGSS
ncbi:helix-turn-helix domain-containing protein [Tuberibacillus sp. Marseille-P3662]|uniref:helix-turn-helix domain-containing protein n=1 Tax=Tuberibacillus sp. Marseille-P3662 TaxID=1965358 RepID=UPI000A1CCA3F|nr:helix-turn-helix domain-containing protein [Tuberibacillus sp. Marseille-P3662]